MNAAASSSRAFPAMEPNYRATLAPSQSVPMQGQDGQTGGTQRAARTIVHGYTVATLASGCIFRWSPEHVKAIVEFLSSNANFHTFLNENGSRVTETTLKRFNLRGEGSIRGGGHGQEQTFSLYEKLGIDGLENQISMNGIPTLDIVEVKLRRKIASIWKRRIHRPTAGIRMEVREMNMGKRNASAGAGAVDVVGDVGGDRTGFAGAEVTRNMGENIGSNYGTIVYNAVPPGPEISRLRTGRTKSNIWHDRISGGRGGHNTVDKGFIHHESDGDIGLVGRYSGDVAEMRSLHDTRPRRSQNAPHDSFVMVNSPDIRTGLRSPVSLVSSSESSSRSYTTQSPSSSNIGVGISIAAMREKSEAAYKTRIRDLENELSRNLAVIEMLRNSSKGGDHNVHDDSMIRKSEDIRRSSIHESNFPRFPSMAGLNAPSSKGWSNDTGLIQRGMTPNELREANNPAVGEFSRLEEHFWGSENSGPSAQSIYLSRRSPNPDKGASAGISQSPTREGNFTPRNSYINEDQGQGAKETPLHKLASSEYTKTSVPRSYSVDLLGIDGGTDYYSRNQDRTSVQEPHYYPSPQAEDTHHIKDIDAMDTGFRAEIRAVGGLNQDIIPQFIIPGSHEKLQQEAEQKTGSSGIAKESGMAITSEVRRASRRLNSVIEEDGRDDRPKSFTSDSGPTNSGLDLTAFGGTEHSIIKTQSAVQPQLGGMMISATAGMTDIQPRGRARRFALPVVTTSKSIRPSAPTHLAGNLSTNEYSKTTVSESQQQQIQQKSELSYSKGMSTTISASTPPTYLRSRRHQSTVINKQPQQNLLPSHPVVEAESQLRRSMLKTKSSEIESKGEKPHVHWQRGGSLDEWVRGDNDATG